VNAKDGIDSTPTVTRSETVSFVVMSNQVWYTGRGHKLTGVEHYPKKWKKKELELEIEVTELKETTLQ
jgi:hypothetical protein